MKTLYALLLLAAIGAGGLWYADSFSGANAALPGQTVLQVQRKTLEDTVTALGKLEPAAFVDVGAQVSGQLMKLHVELGSVVQKDQLLAEIDPRLHVAQVEADRATLANLEAGLVQGKASLLQARRNYERDRQLHKQNATSLAVLQTSETSFRIAEAQVVALEAQIQQAKANLVSNETNLSLCRVYAPIAGTIVSLPVKEGQTLNNKQTAPVLMRVADLAVMTVWASVSEADVNKLRSGMSVYFTTLGDAATRHYAVLDKVHPSYVEDNDVILYDAVFTVQNPDNAFLPAMNAQVFFVRDAATNVLTLPVDSLPPTHNSGQKNGDTVNMQVLRPDGSTQERLVTLGLRTRTSVEVRSGLEEGEQVLVIKKTLAASNAGFKRNSGPRL